MAAPSIARKQGSHMIKSFAELVERAATWPKEAQDQLVQAGRGIEAMQSGFYEATDDELTAIDAADAGELATEEEIRATLAKFRQA